MNLPASQSFLTQGGTLLQTGRHVTLCSLPDLRVFLSSCNSQGDLQNCAYNETEITVNQYPDKLQEQQLGTKACAANILNSEDLFKSYPLHCYPISPSSSDCLNWRYCLCRKDIVSCSYLTIRHCLSDIGLKCLLHEVHSLLTFSATFTTSIYDRLCFGCTQHTPGLGSLGSQFRLLPQDYYGQLPNPLLHHKCHNL